MQATKQIKKWVLGLLIVSSCAVWLLAYDIKQDKNPADTSRIEMPLDSSTLEALQTIVNSRVLFTHQSLGGNIMEGLEEIINEAGLTSEGLVKTLDRPLPQSAAMVHLTTGKNGYPETKIDAFAQIIRGLETFVPQVAGMKFCFVDFDPHTDVDQVLDYYKDRIETLKKERPGIKFVHVTVPLKERKENLKQRINRFLGRMVWNDESNLKRAEFNQRLLVAFKEDPVFDLARIESTRQDGSREQHRYKGREYYSLAPEYTDDGAHLNGLGKRLVAIEMANFLSKTINVENATQ